MRKSHIILLALPCLLWACGTTKQAVNNAGQKQETVSTVAKQKEVTGKQNATATSLSFVQKVSDNSVYAQNIVSSMTFSIKAGNKDISAPGSLRMRKDKMIRLQTRLYLSLVRKLDASTSRRIMCWWLTGCTSNM